MPSYATACLLSHRAVLCIGGDDRHAFLQGLISNDVTLCTASNPIHAALLTPQGKFLHDLFVCESGNSFLIDGEASRIDDLLQRLTTYKLRAKVFLENVASEWAVWAFPKGGAGLADPRLPALGSRGIFAKDKQFDDFEIVNETAYDLHRLALGVPDGSRDMVVGKSTLSDGNFDLLNGISWVKGCYIGQELTARMHHRTLVKKRMFPVKIAGTPPAPGTIIRWQDEDIGDMHSAAGSLGLALLNIETMKELIKENEAIPTETARLTPYAPDWLDI